MNKNLHFNWEQTTRSRVVLSLWSVDNNGTIYEGSRYQWVVVAITAIFFISFFSSFFPLYFFLADESFFIQIVQIRFGQKNKLLTGRKQRLKKHLIEILLEGIHDVEYYWVAKILSF